MKQIAILCGGQSYEHEVSIITGIQVAEAIDRSQYQPLLIYFDKNNVAYLQPSFKTRQDFKGSKGTVVSFIKTNHAVLLQEQTFFHKQHTIDACYLAFHGGTGESGGLQGMLEVLGLPFTSASSEGSVIAMNKALTKEVLKQSNVSVLPWLSVFATEYYADKEAVLDKVKQTFTLPVIIKPVHLGSSIGIEIAHTEVELEKFLTIATRLDQEVLVEPALKDFTEYNISLRDIVTGLEFSPIEEPKRGSEILTFADKYTRGSKKAGGKAGGGGMELSDRTVPAKIPDSLAADIKTLAEQVYRATRLSGLVRIDFMYHENTLYCTEINPIPGSMSFYLWEPAGEQFSEQITKLIDAALTRHRDQIEIVPYESDIVEKFLATN